MANALGDLMDETEHVYVMGHQYADMDTLGAAAGVCAIARKRGKVARIVMDTENNSVGPMLRKLKALPEYKDVFIGGGDAVRVRRRRRIPVRRGTDRRARSCERLGRRAWRYRWRWQRGRPT